VTLFRNYRSLKKQSTPRSYLSCKTLHSAFNFVLNFMTQDKTATSVSGENILLNLRQTSWDNCLRCSGVEHIFENVASFWLGFCFSTTQNDPSFLCKKKYEMLNFVLFIRK